MAFGGPGRGESYKRFTLLEQGGRTGVAMLVYQQAVACPRSARVGEGRKETERQEFNLHSTKSG